MKKKIAVVFPKINLGGSEAVLFWLLESLKNTYNVSLITYDFTNFEKYNLYYGTSIQEDEVSVISLPLPRLFKNKFDALRPYRLARFCKKIAPQFDVMISAYGVMDFGRLGIQCIADFSFDDNLRRKFDGGYKDSWLRKLYLLFARLLSGTSVHGWKKNLTLANSVWTQEVLKKYLGMDSTVVYPPLAQNVTSVPWEQKKDGFVFLGRISPEKKIESIINIVKEVRKSFPTLTLHLVGPEGDKAYAARIKKVCQENNRWCFLEGAKYGQEKFDFLAGRKYGISARTNEPFGIAVGEMAKSGCLVFVPDGGGQTEIVNSAELTYNDEDDAVAKIIAVMGNPAGQKALQEHLSHRSSLFSAEKFKQEAATIIAEFLQHERS